MPEGGVVCRFVDLQSVERKKRKGIAASVLKTNIFFCIQHTKKTIPSLRSSVKAWIHPPITSIWWTEDICVLNKNSRTRKQASALLAPRYYFERAMIRINGYKYVDVEELSVVSWCRFSWCLALELLLFSLFNLVDSRLLVLSVHQHLVHNCVQLWYDMVLPLRVHLFWELGAVYLYATAQSTSRQQARLNAKARARFAYKLWAQYYLDTT